MTLLQRRERQFITPSPGRLHTLSESPHHHYVWTFRIRTENTYQGWLIRVSFEHEFESQTGKGRLSEPPGPHCCLCQTPDTSA